MDPSLDAQAEQRFQERLSETGAPDPRPRYRDLLRALRERDEAGYRECVQRYREEVVRAIALGTRDPFDAWLSFGKTLAERFAPGELLRIDPEGRASPAPLDASWTELLLQIPGDPRSRAIAVSIPRAPSLAQEATLALLVEGESRLSRSDPRSSSAQTSRPPLPVDG
jgi:hypothetical protein